MTVASATTPAHQRSRLVLALLIALAACCTPSWAAEGPAGDACGPDCAAVFIQPLFRGCLLAINASVVFPEDVDYDEARRTFNARVLRSPAAVFYATSTAEVSEAVKCANSWGVKVTPAAGRQGFQGASVQDGYLVIDVTSMTATSLSTDKKLFTVGAGSSNVMTLSALHATNITGAALTTGLCSFVGTSGFNLGGGFGLLGRYLGLGCDNVVALEAVLADGSIVQANATSHPDLLWASCGGGGGTFAIVTSFTYTIAILPNEGRMSYLAINYLPGVETTVAAFMAFQKALPTLDNRVGLTYDLSFATFALSGVFLGEPAEGVQVLEAAGLLSNLDPAGPSKDDILQAFPSYYDLAAQKVVPNWAPGGMPWGSAGNFTATPANMAFMAKLMSGQDELKVVGGPAYNVWHYSQSRLSGLLPEAGVRALVQLSKEMSDACDASEGIECLLSISGHVLGGAYNEKASDATAFPHRDKYFIIDGVVGVSSDLAASLSGTPETVPLLAIPANISNRVLTTIKPFIGTPEAAYVNYQPNALAEHEQAFFGSNTARLQAIKASYDPLGVFDKPGTVNGASAAAAPDETSKAAAPSASSAPPPPPASPASGASPRGTTAALLATLALAAATALAGML